MSDVRLPINYGDTGKVSRDKINDSFNDVVRTVEGYRPHIESGIWWIGETNTGVKARGDSISMKVEDGYIWYKSESASWTQIIAIEDLKGDKGDQGDAATITVGSTTTGAAGTSASVENVGTSGAAIFNFTIPRGAKGEPGQDGEDGENATIEIGTTTTGEPGTDASVTNTGTSTAAVLNFTIPEGAKGDPGEDGEDGEDGNGIASITSSKSGKITTVTITETNGDIDTFTVSDGEDGQGAGDVLGPNSSTDGNVVLFDGVTGKLIKDSGKVLPTQASDVGALPSSTKYGASLTVSIDSDYKVTTTLKDQDGNTLGTAQVIDLPLESVVVGGSYDDQTKKVILTLQNGNTIEFSVADLVSGLQSEITSSNKLDADLVDDSTTTNKFVTASDKTTWSGKQDALTLPATPTSGHLVTWGANNKTFADGGAIPTIVYATQAEYTALLPGAASDGKHYLIYHDTGGWQPGAHTLLYLPLEGDVDDYSGNGNDGIRTNDGTTEDTTIAQYLTLSSNKVVAKINGTGSSGSHPTIVVPSFNTAPKTISLWVYKSYSGESGYNDTGVSGWKTVAGQLAGDGQNGWEFRVSGSVDGQSNIWYQCGDWSNGRIFPSGGYSYQGQRLHLVATCNNSITSYYINGVLKGSLGKVIQANNDLWIGTAPFEYGNVTNAFFWGCFSEVILEDIEWTATDIANYYNDTKAQYGIS